MRTIVCYYSGTGNALTLAKQLKDALGGETELMRVTDHKNEAYIELDADAVGFVFPVYFLTTPAIVKEFIKKARFKGNPYMFAVAACNSVPGHSFFTLGRLLKKKGRSLSAGWSVAMPGVSVIEGYLTSKDVNLKRIEDSKIKMMEIAAAVNSRAAGTFDGENSIKSHVGSILMTRAADAMMSPKLFYTTDKCVGCGVCASVCPAGNISMNGTKPVWGKECMHCMACLHWCTNEAAELGEHSRGKARFRHPDVTLEEMVKTGARK